MDGMRYLLLFILFFIPLSLFAFLEPHTEYTEDHFYITRGELDFELDVWEVGTVLLKYNDYSRWALRGMQGIDKESEGLIAYFTDIRYSAGENLFYVTFDLNLIWPFGRKGSQLRFRPFQAFDSEGRLASITLVPIMGNKMVHSANLVFNLRETATGSSLSYESRIRLAPLLDFFFSLRSYRKNFEWYVFKLSENLTDHLQGL